MLNSNFPGPEYHLQERLIPKSLVLCSSFPLAQALPAVVVAGAQVRAPDQHVHGSLRPKGATEVLYMPKPIKEC